jgi:hypothetical protein
MTCDAKISVKKFVIVESPFAGFVPRNIAFARACLRDCILRGEAPYASHLLYTQPGVLDDSIMTERELGMNLGWNVMVHADLVAIYTDLGWSGGMCRGKEAATASGVPYEERTLCPPGRWEGNWHAQYVDLTHAEFRRNNAFPNV